MKAIRLDDWKPTDGIKLEDNALMVAKSDNNTLVVAGPGAGKTELLAQRAACLLQTNLCTYPRKILAISFKKDAAFNLKERVKLRCGDELTKRFDSFTFDAFAKQLLDRFKYSLPKDFQVQHPYKILYNEKAVLDYYRDLDVDFFHSTQEQAMLRYHHEFPFHDKGSSNDEKLRISVWKKMIAENPAILTFKMIMMLAEHIINCNPKIKDALQKTYQFVFLDEFQDTTGLQYSFLKQCFIPSETIFTAVGDDKQRIMRWAGANEQIFEEYTQDTDAENVPLKMNFRSAPRLVALQNYLMEHLLGKTDFATAADHWDEDAGVCDVCVYKDQQQETEDLFKQISEWIEKEKINPREICILVKQKLDKYAATFIDYFNNNGIKARDESVIQDLIANDIGKFITSTIYLCFSKDAQSHKNYCIHFLTNIRTEILDDQILKTESQFAKFVKTLRDEYSEILSQDDLSGIVDRIIGFADKEKICSSYPSHNSIADLDEMVKSYVDFLCKYFLSTKNIISALDGMLGVDTIPIMTIHKSKGLEYQSVVFIGLEDGAFWNFHKQPDEDKSVFFVALSRAKERIVFTFCQTRDEERQSITKIDVILKTLDASKLVNIIDKTKTT